MEKAFNKAQDKNLKDVVRFDKLTAKLRDQGQSAFLSCFKDKFETMPDFAAVTKHVAAVVEALARN
jgi:hypothetical protein